MKEKHYEELFILVTQGVLSVCHPSSRLRRSRLTENRAVCQDERGKALKNETEQNTHHIQN